MDVFIGSLMLVPYNFEPRGFAFCDGRLMSIAEHTALFALLGTQFGGDGKTSFALPDLRGRVPIGAGQGPGLRDYQQAVPGGSEVAGLTLQQMPAHVHDLKATNAPETLNSAQGALLGRVPPDVGNIYRTGAAADSHLAPQTAAPAGQNRPHENRSPYLAMNWVIALSGIFPDRP